MEKIDIHDSENEYSKALIHLKKDVSKRNYELITSFLEASAIGKTARKNARKKQVGTRARMKNLFLLKTVAKFLNKDLDKITIADMERLIQSLNENKLRKSNGEAYSEQTKSNLKITLIIFLRYYIKDLVRFDELTSWIETSFKKKEIPALYEEDIKKLLSKCYTPQQRVLICFLFDAGCRIEEFLNVRMSDITEVKDTIPYYKVTLREEFSKTSGRTIGLFWKPTTEAIRIYLEDHPNKNKLNEQFFPSTYDGVKKVLYKIGKRALGRSVNAHLFRHSSATFYSGQGFDYFQLCKRYGWSIGSRSPQTYIDKSGIKEREVAQKFIDANVKDLSMKLEVIEKQRRIEKEMYENRLKAFESDVTSIKDMLQQIKIQKKK